MKNGRTITIVVRQDSEGDATLGYDSSYHFDGGYGELTQEADAKDVIVATKINDFIFTTIASDVKQISVA